MRILVWPRRQAGRWIALCAMAWLGLAATNGVGRASQAGAARAGGEDGDRVVLITLDGARTEEIFGGLDAGILKSTLKNGQKLEDDLTYKRFWAETPEARRQKLLPFFWGTLMAQHGSIAGDPRLGSVVRLTNKHWFSYPGYAEILLGEAHDAEIKSNDAIRNPYPTVLEVVRERLSLPRERVAAFGSWGVFNSIVEHTEGAIVVNAGVEAFEHADPELRGLSTAQSETQPPWSDVRFDYYTFRFAMAHFAKARPRLVYIAFDETDDWQHDGRYDRLLEAYARTDRYLEQLWNWLQSQDDYCGRTHLVITTDHGRGHTPKDWRDHGAKVVGAEDVWVALVSPRLSVRGPWKQHAPLATNQIAATIARWMGVDWNAGRPAAGRPIEAPGGTR